LDTPDISVIYVGSVGALPAFFHFAVVNSEGGSRHFGFRQSPATTDAALRRA
jgi:hypothetical protein